MMRRWQLLLMPTLMLASALAAIAPVERGSPELRRRSQQAQRNVLGVPIRR